MNEAQNQKFGRILFLETCTSNLGRAELALAMMTMDDAERAAYDAYRVAKAL